jgi:hypothetical protein
MKRREPEIPELARGGASRLIEELAGGVHVSVWHDTDPKAQIPDMQFVDRVVARANERLGLKDDRDLALYGWFVGRLVAAELARSPGFTIYHGIDPMHPTAMQPVDLGIDSQQIVMPEADVAAAPQDGGQV